MALDQANSASHGYTLTALNRWSVANKKLPPVGKINTVHVYDFDNTLFQTPLPNPKIWNASTLGLLGTPYVFINGGWWHDSRILAATGEGVEQEEKRAWNGWWNEKIVELVRLSMKQDDALCVLLTGRSEHGFSQLIKRIVASRGLEFDLIGLKPSVGPNNERFPSTMVFKQAFLRAVLGTYKTASEIRVYEDRPKHVAGFRDFLADYNSQQISIGRSPITAEVIPVSELSTTLDPVVEVAEVQHLINVHNELVKKKGSDARGAPLTIKKTVFFTSYMIAPDDTKRLIKLLNSQVPDVTDLKYLANTILITPRPCPKNILDKIGGMNSKMKWEVVDIGSLQGNIWAARVRPVPANATYHTDNPSPSVVLGLRRGARPPDVNKIRNWQPIPPDKSFVFETTVGEKYMLRIEREDQDGDQYESQHEKFSHRGSKRKFPGDDDRHSRQHGGNFGNNNARDYHTSTHQGHGRSGGGGDNRGRGGYRGGNASRGNRGGGRGGFKGSGRGGKGGAHGYRSLDDVETRENPQSGFNPSTVSYDDTFPSLQGGGVGGSGSSGPPHPQLQPPLPIAPQQYGQLFPQHGQWPAPGGPPPPPSAQSRPIGGPGPDLQSFY
ncbi:uncharacterized protein F4812DRAFT_458797 [Daldinia caldariorum]|uniref:uncharacterized protein n=1 Tax=Daldinia caldariorum TaxID=326644 RepID=UPI002007285A|nr:uncharacterized protein F4812DRAFT_458797 [Daldinia caldariorum]KAI1468361.1 hypothetical protein F4812DRAFT_458797 [Daldinia caldariorum]